MFWNLVLVSGKFMLIFFIVGDVVKLVEIEGLEFIVKFVFATLARICFSEDLLKMFFLK